MNTAWFHLLNNLAGHSAWFDGLVVFGAVGLPYLLVVIAGLALFRLSAAERAEAFRFVLLSVAAAWLVTQLIRLAYPLPRPQTAGIALRALVPHPGNNSFPSEHATVFFALATALWFYLPAGLSADKAGKAGRKKIAVAYFVGAFIIGLSRIIAGIHWPADILGGMVIGILIPLVGYWLKAKYYVKS